MAGDTPALLDRVESGPKATDATTVEPMDGSSVAEVKSNSNRGIHFWLVYVALCLSLLLAALDLVSLHDLVHQYHFHLSAGVRCYRSAHHRERFERF